MRLAALAVALTGAPAAALAEETKPVKLGISYTTDLFTNASGGLERGGAWLGRADATLEADGSAFGIEGATLFLDVVYTHGPDFSGRKVGDAQVVSNVQGDGILRPYEAWISVPVAEGLSAKAGLIDLNTEFDVQSVGAFFTNSSHGIGIDFSQSGRNGPSIFPVTSAAATVRWERGAWRIGAGLFNAVSGNPERPKRVRVGFPGKDGSLLVTEAAVALTPSLRAQAGAWTYTSAEETIDDPGVRVTGSRGAYGQLELGLAERANGDRLEAWIRSGTASARTNRVTFYLGGGLTFGSDDRKIGIAVAHARQSERAARHFDVEEGPQLRAETSFELGYAMALNENVAVQPVAHYVLNPGWRKDVPDALVLGVRFSFSFER